MTRDDLATVLGSFGYYELNKRKTEGSRRKFVDDERNLILLHEPPPGKIVKEDALRQVATLKEKEKIKDEWHPKIQRILRRNSLQC